METLAGVYIIICCSICAAFVGAILRDWTERKSNLNQMKEQLKTAQDLVDEYKAILSKVNEIDAARANAIVTLGQRLEAVEMKINLASVASSQNIGGPRR